MSLALDTVLDTACRAPDTLDDTSSLVSARTYKKGQHQHLLLPSYLVPDPCTSRRGGLGGGTPAPG